MDQPDSGDSYDVFLCHSSQDWPAVRELAGALRERHLRVVLDEGELIAGSPWMEALEEAIQRAHAVVVLYGPSGIGPWALREMRVFLEELTRRGAAIIPTMLPGSPRIPELPLFLQQFGWVDLRDGVSGAGFELLVRGIQAARDSPVPAPRRDLSDEELEQRVTTNRRMQEILAERFLPAEYSRIGGWSAAIMPFVKGATSTRFLLGEERRSSRVNLVNHVIDLYNEDRFAEAAQECDSVLEEYPLGSDFLVLKGLALLRMGRVQAADEALRLGFGVEHDNAALYNLVIQSCGAAGRLIYARPWAREGAQYARDRRSVLRTWLTMEEHAGRIYLARACLDQLQALGEPDTSVEELRVLLDGLERRRKVSERELANAWELLQRGQMAEAGKIARALIAEHAHHAPTLLLAGVLAFEQEQWASSVEYLRHAFTLEPAGDPDVPFFLGHAYLKLDRVRLAAATHELWVRRLVEVMDGPVQSARAGRAAEDGSLVVEQGRTLLATYPAISDAHSGLGPRIGALHRDVRRLMDRLTAGVHRGEADDSQQS